MSGHSKWATTKRQKSVVDAKRSSLFTKLSKNIMVAAREGADPTMNFKLRIAVDTAKGYSMPKDNIDRAIAKGSGTDTGAQLYSVLYEGYGPGGIAVIADAITDNKNRTASEIKHIFTTFGGNIGGSGSVMWMFDMRGLITLKEPKLTDDQELVIIDAGAIDIAYDPDGVTITTPVDKLQTIRDLAEQNHLTVANATAAYIPKSLVKPTNDESVIQFLDELDEQDDVNSIATNANV